MEFEFVGQSEVAWVGGGNGLGGRDLLPLPIFQMVGQLVGRVVIKRAHHLVIHDDHPPGLPIEPIGGFLGLEGEDVGEIREFDGRSQGVSQPDRPTESKLQEKIAVGLRFFHQFNYADYPADQDACPAAGTRSTRDFANRYEPGGRLVCA